MAKRYRVSIYPAASGWLPQTADFERFEFAAAAWEDIATFHDTGRVKLIDLRDDRLIMIN